MCEGPPAKDSSTVSALNSPELSGDNLASSVDLLARGEQLLQRFSLEAEAARAAARLAELSQILADARHGNDRELRVWLARHDQLGYAPASPTIESQQVEPAISSWEAILPAARSRLAARATHLQVSESGRQIATTPAIQPRAKSTTSLASSTGETSSETSCPIETTEIGKRLRIDPPLPRKQSDVRSDATGGVALPNPAEKTCDDGTSSSLENKRSRTTEPSEKKSGRLDQPSKSLAEPQLVKRAKPAPELAELAKKFDAEELEEQHAGHRRIVLFSRMGGIVASIILHILAVIVLAVITLKLPAPPASLAFESSSDSTTEDTFELTEPMDVTDPEQVSESLPVPDVAIDLATDLSSLTSSDALSQNVASPAQSLAGAAQAAAQASSGKPNPMNASASFFGAAASGNCFCYVIDSSTSMKGGPWEAAKFELLRSLSSFEPKQRFHIIFFNQKLDIMPAPGQREPAGSALYANQENVDHARRWIDTIRISKGDPPKDALEYAINLEPDAIYLLTDGDTTSDVTGFLRDKNRVSDFIGGEQVKVPIHAIAFYSPVEGQTLMKKVAQENNGQFIYVPDPSKR
ncbi:MAG: VWA domain-containing protein [Pirellulaceae bacterium]